MKRALVLMAVFAVGVALASPAYAQFARAGLEGRVVDPDGAPLPGVTVTVLNQANGQTRTTVTSANGRYVLNGLTPGTYTARFELQGFSSYEQPDLQLLVGQSPSLDAAMQLGGVAETITITGESPLIETTSKEIGGNVTAEDFVTLPTQGRSFVLFAGLLPGVQVSPDTESTASDSLFINGQDDNNNSFNVDGANNDDDVIGARAGAQTRTAIEAIQEFQILTSQFDAEFGRSVGGVLNAITKSGGNIVHGSGFFFYQDSSLNDPNFFTERSGLDKPDFTFKSFGGTLGGPIARDRLHFFGSYERQTPNEGIARQFSTRPEFDFTTTEANVLQNWMAKLDWQTTDEHKVAVRFLREWSPQFNQIIGGNTTLESSREEFDKDTSFVGSIDSVVSDTGFNNFRGSFTRENVAFANPGFNNGGQDFATQRSLDVSENRPGILLGASTVASARTNNSVQFDDTFSLFLSDWIGGDHDLRFGGNYSDRSTARNDASVANGQFVFDTDVAWDPANLDTYPNSFTIRVGGAAGEGINIPHEKAVGIFFQDDFQPTENLTLNLGVRWDHQSTVEDNNNIGPRLGFAWDPNGTGKTVVRGGFGRFYDRFPLGSFQNFFVDAVRLDRGFNVRTPLSGNDPQLFFDIAQANGFTTLNQLRDFIANDLESGLGAAFNSAPTVDTSRTTPYADTLTVGVEHEVGTGLSIGVDLIHTENKNIQVVANLNPFSRSQGGRPNISVLDGDTPSFGSINTYVNAGESTYNGLQFSLQRRMMQSAIGRFSARVSYTYSDQGGNVEPASLDGLRYQFRTETGYNFDTGSLIGAPFNLGLDHPASQDFPANWNRTHNFVTSWTWLVPGTASAGNQGLMVSGVFRAMSGDRFTPQLESRLDNNNREVAPAGTYSANQPSDIAVGPIESTGRDLGARNPGFARLDLSLRYRIGLGQLIGSTDYNLTLMADAFNITDRTNFSNRGSSRVAQDAFLIPTAARSPREFQLGVRVDW